jgi:hypothetical protein
MSDILASRGRWGSTQLTGRRHKPVGFSIIVSGTENDRTENDRTAEPIQNSPVFGFCVLGSMGRYLCNKRDSWVPWVRSLSP